MEFEIRFGRSEDTPVVAECIRTAGGGLFEFLLEGIIPGLNPQEMLRLAVADKDSVFNYTNAILATTPQGLAGLILAYPSEDYGIPPLVETVVPRKRLDHVRPLLSSRIPESWYINTVVVAEWARGQGVGRMLLEFTADVAVENGFDTLSLHAWADNSSALRLYADFGFETVAQIAVAPAKHLNHEGGMLLLRAPVKAA